METNYRIVITEDGKYAPMIHNKRSQGKEWLYISEVDYDTLEEAREVCIEDSKQDLKIAQELVINAGVIEESKTY